MRTITMNKSGANLGCVLLLTIVIGSNAIITRETTRECKKISQCQCEIEPEDENGANTYIDLSPLDSGTTKYAYFRDLPAVEPNVTDRYSWNPCTPFCEVHCEGAATCQNASVAEDLFYTCGNHTNANFQYGYNYTKDNVTLNTSGLVLTYSYKAQGLLRYSIIKLNCDKDVTQDLQVYGEYFGVGDLHYFFNFTSKYACPVKNESGSVPYVPPPQPPDCPHPWTTTTVTSPTTTTTEAPQTHPPTKEPSFLETLTWVNLVFLVLIALAVIFVSYCIIGIVVNLFRGRRGSRLIPNNRLWKAVLMKFTCHCCRDTSEADQKTLIDG